MNQLADGRIYTRTETFSTFTTLGVRFWDATTGAQIRAGLRVGLWPVHTSSLAIDAVRTVSDIYAFHRVPGLRSVERPRPDENPGLGSPPTRDYVLEIVDLRDRFVPCAVGLSLPVPERGLYLTQLIYSPDLPSPGFFLFSSVTRPRAPNIAVLLGQATHGIDGPPAAHALVSDPAPVRVVEAWQLGGTRSS